MRSDVVAHKFDREKWSNELSPFLNLWKKLNQVSAWYLGFDLEEPECADVPHFKGK